jgi:hypothetical protein
MYLIYYYLHFVACRTHVYDHLKIKKADNMDNEYRIYKQKVWEFLDNIEPCINYEIANLCIPENKNKFIACVKSYMDTKTPFQGYIIFNHDYSKIYKTSEITFKPEIL